jgi:hypothetical protein
LKESQYFRVIHGKARAADTWKARNPNVRQHNGILGALWTQKMTKVSLQQPKELQEYRRFPNPKIESIES